MLADLARRVVDQVKFSCDYGLAGMPCFIPLIFFHPLRQRGSVAPFMGQSIMYMANYHSFNQPTSVDVVPNRMDG